MNVDEENRSDQSIPRHAVLGSRRDTSRAKAATVPPSQEPFLSNTYKHMSSHHCGQSGDPQMWVLGEVALS